MVFVNSLRSLHFIYQSFENLFGIKKAAPIGTAFSFSRKLHY